MGGVTSETRSSVSPYAVFDRASWRALAAGSRLPLDEAELRELATPRRPDRPRRGRHRLPAARRAARPARRGQPAAAGPRRRSSWATPPRRCRSSSRVAGSVAVGKSTTARLLQTLLAAAPGLPAGRPGHHRRLPDAERRAGGARPARPQGLPGELRPAGAAALPRRREVRPRGGRRPGLRPPGLRHRARRRGRRWTGPTSSSSRGSTSCRPDGAPTAAPRGLPLGLLRLLRLRRRRRERHPALVRRALPGAAPDRVPGHRPPTSTASPG